MYVAADFGTSVRGWESGVGWRRRPAAGGIGKRMRSPMPALVAALLARGASACDSSYLFPNVTESGEP